MQDPGSGYCGPKPIAASKEPNQNRRGGGSSHLWFGRVTSLTKHLMSFACVSVDRPCQHFLGGMGTIRGRVELGIALLLSTRGPPGDYLNPETYDKLEESYFEKHRDSNI
jgi:hypothetical protein